MTEQTPARWRWKTRSLGLRVQRGVSWSLAEPRGASWSSSGEGGRRCRGPQFSEKDLLSVITIYTFICLYKAQCRLRTWGAEERVDSHER